MVSSEETPGEKKREAKEQRCDKGMSRLQRDKNSIENYRPISLLNGFSKIYEKSIVKRLISFLNKQYNFETTTWF